MTMRETWPQLALRLNKLTIIVVLGAFGPDAWSAQTFSASDIRDRILKSQERIESIEVHYRATGESGYFVDQVIMAKAPVFWFSVTAHGNPTADSDDDFDRQRTFVLEDRFLTYRPIPRTLVMGLVKPTDPLPGTLENELFFFATGLWPFRSRKPPSPLGHAHTLKGIASSDEFIVRDKTEDILGSPCILFTHKSGRDRIWLDIARGCSIVRREFYDQDRASLMVLLEMSQHRQVAEGIWIPFKIHRSEFDTRPSSKLDEKVPIGESTLVVTYASVNDVNDSQFQFTPPPGTLELMPDGSPGVPRQIVAGGHDLLDEYAGWIRKRAMPVRNSATSDVLWELAIASLAAIGIIFYIRFFKRVRRPCS